MRTPTLRNTYKIFLYLKFQAQSTTVHSDAAVQHCGVPLIVVQTNKRLSTCVPQASSPYFGRLYVNGPDLRARARHYAIRSPMTARQSALLQSSEFANYYTNESTAAEY